MVPNISLHFAWHCMHFWIKNDDPFKVTADQGGFTTDGPPIETGFPHRPTGLDGEVGYQPQMSNGQKLIVLGTVMLGYSTNDSWGVGHYSIHEKWIEKSVPLRPVVDHKHWSCPLTIDKLSLSHQTIILVKQQITTAVNNPLTTMLGLPINLTHSQPALLTTIVPPCSLWINCHVSPLKILEASFIWPLLHLTMIWYDMILLSFDTIWFYITCYSDNNLNKCYSDTNWPLFEPVPCHSSCLPPKKLFRPVPVPCASSPDPQHQLPPSLQRLPW